MSTDHNEAMRLATYLDSIFISEDVSAVKARQIAALLRQQAEQIDQLRAEVERMRADAERLDWLEKHDGRFHNLDRISSIVGVGFIPAAKPDFKAKTLRAAIDAARTTHKDTE